MGSASEDDGKTEDDDKTRMCACGRLAVALVSREAIKGKCPHCRASLGVDPCTDEPRCQGAFLADGRWSETSCGDYYPLEFDLAQPNEKNGYISSAENFDDKFECDSCGRRMMLDWIERIQWLRDPNELYHTPLLVPEHVKHEIERFHAAEEPPTITLEPLPSKQRRGVHELCTRLGLATTTIRTGKPKECIRISRQVGASAGGQTG